MSNGNNTIVATIIPKSLETKLKNAIDNEDYELAQIIKTKINKKKMKEMITKMQFKVASWLYNQGIVAPQILECNSVIILPNDYSEKDLDFYTEKQKEIKNHIVE